MQLLILVLILGLVALPPATPLTQPTRRCWLSGMGGAATAAATARVSMATAATASSDPSQALALKKELLAQAARRARGDSAVPSAELDSMVRQLCEMNPTERPGARESFSPLSKGDWRVVYAPHIETLSKFGLTKFDPISYVLDGDRSAVIALPSRHHILLPFPPTHPSTPRSHPTISILSNVRYESGLFGSGWLNAAGSFESVDETTTRIIFDTFWWDIGTPTASENDGMAKRIIQGIGSAGFLPALSSFPIRYLDADLCIFEFPPLGVRITAARQ